MAKIALSLAVGLLFGHQLIAHHHHDDFEISASIHGDHDDAGNHLLPHHIAHIFSVDNIRMATVKLTAQEVFLPADFDFTLLPPSRAVKQREYIEIRPPLLKGHRYFSLRAPPAA